MPETAAAAPAARMLYLHAQTGLHPGSGTALGTVDLPVQRERHTGWPTIPGSALKGILRDRCREAAKGRHGGSRKDANEKDDALQAAFGPGKVDDSSSHAGALSLTDARILAYPVRSLRGVFAWVTCRNVLERLSRDLGLAGEKLPPVPNPVTDTESLAADKSPLLLDGGKLVLEEYEFTRKGDAGALPAWLAANVTADKFTQERLRTHLVVLSDEYFTHFVRNATEIVARVGLDYETKTVKAGALFYQEFLPSETLFYAVVLAQDSRREGHKKAAKEILDYLGGHLPAGSVLQIGGDETVGKGLCLAHLSDGQKRG